jgi:uncharacterized damage-inducible protein DinB
VIDLNKLFHYNWQVRDEWFALCRGLPPEELLKERIGGLGSILKTLFHIVDVEYSWILTIQGQEAGDPDFDQYRSMSAIEAFSQQCHPVVREFLAQWTPEQETMQVKVPWNAAEYSRGEVLRHVIAHEIHHVGQLSVWSRQLGLPPVSANFAGRGIG